MTKEKKRIYCISIYNELFNKINSLNCIPVGLGKNTYSSEWIRDNTGINISNKNLNYGELTFWYWLWKNELKNIPDNTWIGFSQYRRHWYKNKDRDYLNTNFYENVLKEVPKEWNDYDTILGEKITTKKVKFMKLLKYGKKALIKNPKAIISNFRNIKFNFDMMHGTGILDEAIDLLDEDNKEDFREYCKKETSFSPVNMFVCKSKNKIINFFQCLFDWLEKCEHKFGLELKGYRNIRRYAFLAERFMPYWFNKNTKVLEWPIIFHDLREEKSNKSSKFI